MRKTHPVNALKKLGIGLAFGAATIMSMPTSALACTQIYMGKNLTADGNTYYGRAEDFGPRYLKHFGIEPSHAPRVYLRLRRVRLLIQVNQDYISL